MSTLKGRFKNNPRVFDLRPLGKEKSPLFQERREEKSRYLWRMKTLKGKVT